MSVDLAMIRDAIAISDAAEKGCPVNQNRVKGSDPCPLCGAMSNQVCFNTVSADYRAMRMVRQAVASVDRNPEGQDPKGLGAKHKSATPKADAQPSTPSIESEIERLGGGAS